MAFSVAHVSFSNAGGAGGVASRLVEEQRRRGMAAQAFTVIQGDLRSSPLTSPIHTVTAAIDEYVFRQPGFDMPLSLARDKVEGVGWRGLAKFDVVHLHGINGAIRLGTVAKHLSNSHVVWTLHDMNAFTGGCHFALACDGFTRSCQKCPATRSLFHPLVERALSEKKYALKSLNKLSLVSPSHWLASEAGRSAALAGHPIHVINNPISEEFFKITDPQKIDGRTNKLVIGVVAQNLSDPRKNVAEAHRAFLKLIDRGVSAQLFLVGHGGKEFVGPGVYLLGNLSADKIISHMDSWDVLLNPSRAENAPLIIIEAAARGCPSIVANAGGMSAMVSDLGQGATYDCDAELADALEARSQISELERKKSRADLRSRTQKLHAVSNVFDSYLALYQK